MRILFLLSCLEPAGSETYCLALEKAWGKKHQVFWISDELHYGQENHAMPIHMKAFPMGMVNTFRVASFIKKNQINVVHSHSRRAHWVGAQAARLANVPHVTTIHQPMPVHAFSQMFPCLGDQTIAIDEAVRDHLRTHFNTPYERLKLIRNGMDLSRLVPSSRLIPPMREVLIIGRLSGGRWRVFETILSTLERAHSTLPPARYKICGQVPFERRNDVQQRLSILNSVIRPSTIESLGYVKDLELMIRNSDGAIAAGRSALECLALNKPVVLMGEGGVLGLCRPSMWPLALRTNLGDHMDPKDFDSPRLERAIRELLTIRAEQAEIARESRAFVEQYFDIAPLAAQVEGVYRVAGAKES